MASASLQIVSTGTLDSAPVVVFTTESERYTSHVSLRCIVRFSPRALTYCFVHVRVRFLFDCGEGTQRLCTEHKVRLQKVEGIYLTEAKTETLFGLPG